MPYLLHPEDVEDGSENPRRIPFASKDELLAYANRIREAGGANALDALLPSTPQQNSACLIARALNFGCKVYPYVSETDYADGSQRWVMKTPDAGTTRQLAKAIGARTIWLNYVDERVIDRRPEHPHDKLVLRL